MSLPLSSSQCSRKCKTNVKDFHKNPGVIFRDYVFAKIGKKLSLEIKEYEEENELVFNLFLSSPSPDLQIVLNRILKEVSIVILIHHSRRL